MGRWAGGEGGRLEGRITRIHARTHAQTFMRRAEVSSSTALRITAAAWRMAAFLGSPARQHLLSLPGGQQGLIDWLVCRLIGLRLL